MMAVSANKPGEKAERHQAEDGAPAAVSDTPPTDLSGSHSNTGMMTLRAISTAQPTMAPSTISGTRTTSPPRIVDFRNR